MDQFHVCCLCKTAGIKWQDRVPSTEVLRICGIQGIETFLLQTQCYWSGHVIWVPNDCIAKQVVFGQLASGYQADPWSVTKRVLMRTSWSVASSRRLRVRSYWSVTCGAPNAKKPLLSSKQVMLQLWRWSLQLASKLCYRAWMLLSGHAVVVPGSALPELNSLPNNTHIFDVAMCCLWQHSLYSAFCMCLCIFIAGAE